MELESAVERNYVFLFVIWQSWIHNVIKYEAQNKLVSAMYALD